MAETWTVKRCMDWTCGYLKDKGKDRARFAAEWMLSSVTGLSRVELYMNHERPLSPDELSLMHEYVVRRVKGEPLQYITGDTQFRTLRILCEPGVLIPRPETEMLVEEVLGWLDANVLGPSGAKRRVELPWNDEVTAARKAEREAAARLEANRESGEDGDAGTEPEPGAVAGVTVDAGAGPEPDADASAVAAITPDGTEAQNAVQPPAPGPDPTSRDARVLEIGCGTGCVSLSLAAERPGRVTCVATDVDPHAVALSLRNREALGIDPERADFREGDLTSPVEFDERGTFDVLVSNPPYIPESVMAEIPAEVADYEPRLALASGADGLDMFRRILHTFPHMVRPGGLLACELYEGALDAAASLCQAEGLQAVRIVPDLTGRPRFILAQLP